MADEEPSKLTQDGYLSVETNSKHIIYHPNLNTILVSTAAADVHVIDVNSGVILHKSSLSGRSDGCLQGIYLAGHDKILYTDGYGIGARRDYNGVMLLDTILQTPKTKPEETVKLEILLSEALVLEQCLRVMDLAGVDQTSEVLHELMVKISIAQDIPKKGGKAQKWKTVCLELPHGSFREVFGGLVHELKRQNRHIPPLSIGSALLERLDALLPPPGGGVVGGGNSLTEVVTPERALMYSETARRDTFSKWPHMNYKWALPDQMAQAGFYHQPNSTGDDRAMCFTCNVCLVCWEPTDEPWSEHERHSPSCPFVKGEYTQNVPLSVSHATSPGVLTSNEIHCSPMSLGTSSVPELIPSTSRNGYVAIWNISRHLKREVAFHVVPGKDAAALAWSDDTESNQCHLHVTAVSILGGPQHRYCHNRSKVGTSSTTGSSNSTRKSRSTSLTVGSSIISNLPNLRPCLVVGVNANPAALQQLSPGHTTDLVQAMNDVNEAASTRHAATLDIMKVRDHPSEQGNSFIDYRGLYLLVYDFYYKNENSGFNEERGGNGGSHPGNNASSGNVGDGSTGGGLSGGGVKTGQSTNVLSATGGSSKKLISGTGTSSSSGLRSENNFYQELFLTKFLYDMPVIEDVDTEIVMPNDWLEYPTTPASSSSGHPVIYPFGPTQNNPSTATVGNEGSGTGSVNGTDTGGPVTFVSYSTINGSPYSNFPTTSEPGATDSITPPLLIKLGGNGRSKEASDISNEFQSYKPVEPIAVQCLALPRRYRDSLLVHSLHPTKDGSHLLVVLSRSNDSNPLNISNPSTSMDIEMEDLSSSRMQNNSEASENLVNCVLLVYAFDLTSGDVVRLTEQPFLSRELYTSALSPVEVTLLPLTDEEEPPELLNFSSREGPQGRASIVCNDGVVRIFDLGTLKIVSQAAPEISNYKFVSSTYCNSLERLCACTDRGSLHFFILENGKLTPEEKEDEPTLIQNPSLGSTLYTCCSSEQLLTENDSMNQLLIHRPQLGLNELKQLSFLTRYENLTPCYAATVPPCWTEMMQAQKQRRHPQHLQQGGDEVQHTRTWRLQSDATTWDEHVFEMTLPRSCCIAQVDVKFTLHAPYPAPPNVQVTLLKPNASGIGRRRRDDNVSVDHPIHFNLPGNPLNSENPVTSEEYLCDHNSEILCGPMNLASCLDLTDHAGTVSLTGPKLFKIRGRTLLVHIKALASSESTNKNKNSSSNDERASASKKSKLDSKATNDSWLSLYFNNNGLSTSSVGNHTNNNLSSSTKKLDQLRYYVGCDWIHEISITIRNTRQTCIPNERIQRCAMLECNTFFERLIQVAAGTDSEESSNDNGPFSRGLALDLLIWIATVRLSRHRSSVEDLQRQQLELARVLESNLPLLFHRCLLLSGRSIAHKCVKLIIIVSDGMRNCSDSWGEGESCRFDTSVLEALLEWLPNVVLARTAGSLRWYFLLLSRFMSPDRCADTGQRCIQLLQRVSSELSQRANPFHLLLRTRFGLYSTPLEPELFDIEPPTPAKASSVPVTYATVVTGDAASGAPSTATPATGAVPSSTHVTSGTVGSSATGGGVTGTGCVSNSTVGGAVLAAAQAAALAGEALDLRDLLNQTGSLLPSRLRGLTASHYVKGLLEVEPLHFTCHGASDGTKMERLEPTGTTNTGTTVNNSSGAFEPGNFMCYVWENSNLAFKKNSTYQRSTDEEPMDTDNNIKRMQDKKMINCSPIHPPPPWHRLLAAPGQHVLVIERMHSGARRFAVLDFGQPIVLTDLTIPACADLVSLSIDIWCQGEEMDGQRLVVATDIGSKALVMSDLQPAPVCRFLKITTIGRYGMGTTRCKIPIGSFYGHIAVLPGESFHEPHSLGELPKDCLSDQISILNALAEDIHCRYSLACTKLRDLLSPLLESEAPNLAHMQQYFKLTKELHHSCPPSIDTQRILAAFHECTAYQQQLNLVRMAISRLEEAREGIPKIMLESLETTSSLISKACTDKLRVLAESLLDLLLFLTSNLTVVPSTLSHALNQKSCQRLFQCLCIREDTKMQLAACTLLVRTCATQPWWGEFLANIFTHFYAADHSSIFPQDRVFILVTYLGKRSLLCGAPRRSVLEAVFAALVRLLSPLVNSGNSSYLRAKTDLSLIGWLLLFLSACLDTPTHSNIHYTQSPNGENEAQISGSTLASAIPSSTDTKNIKDCQSRINSTNSRWEFLQGELAMQRRAASGIRGSSTRNYRRKLMKKRHVNTWQAMHAMQHFDDLELAKKVFHASTQALSALSSQAINLSSKLEAALKQQEHFFKKTLKQQTSKHLKDFMRSGPLLVSDSSGTSQSPPSSTNGASCTSFGPIVAPSTSHISNDNQEVNNLDILPREHCLAVARGLINLILAMDFTCNMDMFMVACKVAARTSLSARPALRLCDIVTEDQLLQLIRLATWTDQQGAVWGGPWASHAVCCLLHDLVEGGRLYSSLNHTKLQQEQQITTPSSAPVVFSESPPHPHVPTQEQLATPSTSTADLNENEDDFAASTETFLKVANAIGEGSFQLPSLLESDDSELEDILDDILERKRSFYIKKFGNGTSTSGGNSSGNALASSSMGGSSSVGGGGSSGGGTSGQGGATSGGIPNSSSTVSGSLPPSQGTNGSGLVRGGPYSSSSAVSTALDSRLELGVQTLAEVALRRLTASSALNMAVSLTAPILQRTPDALTSSTVWDEQSLLAMLGDDKLYSSAPLDSSQMLANCFERMFVELLPHSGWTNNELVLQLWLNLNLNIEVGEAGMSLNTPGAALTGTNFNTTSTFNPAAMPTIFLGPRAVSGLIDALTWQPNIGIRAWNLAFQCLTLLANSPLSPSASESIINLPWTPEDEVDIALRGLATVIVGDPQFVPMLLRFFSGSGSLDAPVDLATSAAGPSACQAMHDLLVRLQMRCDVVSNDSRPGTALKHLLLKLLQQLVQPGGAIASRRGPLDAQCAFVELLLNLNYLYGDLTTAMKIFESVASLIYNYISTTEKVKCRSVNESGSSSTTDCFGDLLAGASSSRGAEPAGKTSSTNRHGTSSGWDHLARALLKLCCWLIQTPLSNPDSMETSSDDISQTDEHKARNPSNWSHTRTVCIADSVLQHVPTMTKLLAALAASNGNSPFFTNRNSEPPSLAHFSSQMTDPNSVSEGLYHLLMTLAVKASSPDLILRPLLDYFASACPIGCFGVVQLSEPMLWFILCVLETSLKEFNTLGGIRIICENLVRSNQTLINSHPSMLSIVTQHLSTAPPMTNINTKKINTPIETYEGLMNFAPLGAISFNNPTAQPADVLLLATPAHRRARTAAWTYYFYPDEQWVELTIVLPCAVLLKEVQLQPHLTSLATGPSAVSLEASRDIGGILVPLGPPLRTSGLTYIRLFLPHPEVVSQILIRLYRPRDSSNIGLSQIRLLGSTAFGEISVRANNAELIDQDLTRTSLGWLRLAHVTICKPANGSPLAHSVAASAASVNGFLEACCGLLLIPAPAPAYFAGNLERVLLRLGLHSRDLGLRLINTLLQNGAMASLDAIDSVVELIFRLCTCIDESTHDRVSSLLNWLNETAGFAINYTRRSVEENDIYTSVAIAPSVASYIHAAAAVIWESHENIQNLNYDLPSMITNELFSLLYKWSIRVAPNSALKRSIDTLLCSLCAVRPALFPALLHRMEVLVPNLSSMPDDHKDQNSENSIIDDSKEHIALDWDQDEWYSRLTIQPSERIHFSDSQLLTIAASCQSPVCIQQLLDSGLPLLLVQGIVEFCQNESHQWKINQPMETENPQPSTSMTDADKPTNRTTFGVDTISSILYFFAEICTESKMRDWLGSPEGSLFWTPLLSLLSAAETLAPTRGESYSRLEAAMVKFLSRCCWCQSSNQQLLAKVLCNIIGDHKTFTGSANIAFVHGLSGLTRRLVLQLLLENEKIFVHVRTDFPLHRNSATAASVVPCPTHPRFGTGHYHQLLYLSTETTCSQLINLLTANSLNGEVSHDIGVSGDTGNGGSVSGLIKVRSDLYDVDLTDNLSMATAGVTARDKRVKEIKNSLHQRSLISKKLRHLAEASASFSSLLAGASGSSSSNGGYVIQALQHAAWPGGPLPGSATLSQILASVRTLRGFESTITAPCLSLSLGQTAVNSKPLPPDTQGVGVSADRLASSSALITPLQVFSQRGGLALLARHLPLVYPQTLRYPTSQITNWPTVSVDKANVAASSTPPDHIDADWVKVECPDEFEDFIDSVPPGSGSPGAGGISGNGGRSGFTTVAPTVPPHSLAAFGLFLRLPGYAEVLLRDKRKAQCLLRLVLGVTDDGEGGDIFDSAIASSLHTLPFCVLRQLLDATPLSTDDGLLLRRTTLEVGAVHLLLGCLAVFTHHPQGIDLPGLRPELMLAATGGNGIPYSYFGGIGCDARFGSGGQGATNTCSGQTTSLISGSGPSGGANNSGTAAAGGGSGTSKSDDKSHLYWAKGTGFGTGSTTQSWNVEQALLRQKSEEEHVTVLLQVLSSYINPGGVVPEGFLSSEGDDDSPGEEESKESTPIAQLPKPFHELVEKSCLLPAISSYLRNDSVLDMSRHIPLYKAVLRLLRAMALDSQLAALLLPQERRADQLSVVCLLTRMNTYVDNYATRLKLNKSGVSKGNTRSSVTIDESDQDAGLALLIPDIQETARLVQTATERLVLEDDEDSGTGFGENGGSNGKESRRRLLKNNSALERPLANCTLEERYLEVMKRLQFDTYEMISEDSGGGGSGGYRFAVSYHFEANMRAAGERGHPSRVKRLAQEAVTLSSSLPLSYSSSVFVRCDQDRLDVMKVLITGPADTPYANGCFEFDVYFPPDYPNSPMLINLETTGHHAIRFNPNLYNDGKVCLSVLNTWHGRPEEKWNAHTSSFLQVLVSIQSLILVPEPYFNEPGYERSRGTASGNQSSLEYNSNICQATVKWAMLEQLRNPCPCFAEVIHTHFWLKRDEITHQIEEWIAELEFQSGDSRTGRAISANNMALQRHFRLLKDELGKLKIPPGLEDLENVDNANAISNETSSTKTLTTTTTTTVSSSSSITNTTSGTSSSTTTTSATTPNEPSTSTTSTSSSSSSEPWRIPSTATTTTVIQPQETNSSSLDDLQLDSEMEKLVSKVCE